MEKRLVLLEDVERFVKEARREVPVLGCQIFLLMHERHEHWFTLNMAMRVARRMIVKDLDNATTVLDFVHHTLHFQDRTWKFHLDHLGKATVTPLPPK